MHYIAWRIGAGAVPYRDIFDMNFPGVYALHLAALGLFGAGDAGWRAFDLAWLAATSLAAAALAAPWGRLAAAGAGLLLAALGVARWPERPAERTSLAWGGLALGAGITVKPHAGLLAAALLALVALVAYAEGRPLAAPVAVFAAALVVPTLAAVAWLAAAGALPAWYEIVAGYLVPLYSRLGGPERWTFYRWHVWIPIAAGVALALGSAVAGRRFAARHAVVAVGLGYGAAHFFGQDKGWEYHLYPLAAFAAVALFAELPRLLEARRLAALPLLACVVAAGTMLGLKGVEAADAAWIAARERRVQALVADLDGRIAPEDFVQVLDTTEAGIHALLRLHAVQPTRFIYDFHFYHDTQTRTVQRLREEFLAGFDAHPPKFVVLFERGWPAGGYERVDQFPGLRLRLSAYRVDRRRDGYIVYAR